MLGLPKTVYNLKINQNKRQKFGPSDRHTYERKLLFYQFEFFTNFGKKDNILNFSEEVEAADAIIQNNGN